MTMGLLLLSNTYMYIQAISIIFQLDLKSSAIVANYLKAYGTAHF